MTLFFFVFFVGGNKKESLEPEIRRRAVSLSTPHRASDVHVDPLRSAILFRDARGVSTCSVLNTFATVLILPSQIQKYYHYQ